MVRFGEKESVSLRLDSGVEVFLSDYVDIVMKRLRDAEDSLYDKLSEFVAQTRFREDREKAFQLWLASYGVEPSETDMDILRFRDWFIHDHRLRHQGDVSILKVYCREKTNELSGLEIEVVKAWLNTTPDLYEVTGIEEDKRIGLRELFSEKEYMVTSPALTQHVARGDFVLTRIASLDNLFFLVGRAALCYHKSTRARLIDYCEDMFEEYRKWNPGGSWNEFMERWGNMFNHPHTIREPQEQ